MLLPGNKGVFKMSSAKMHPRLHISIESSQEGSPNKISGGLYHLDATYSVSTPSLLLISLLDSFNLAIPKSQILI